MTREIDEHRIYLRGRQRLSAYERALQDVVRPGAVVVDFVAGTGILGMLACRAGAARVYAIEQRGIGELAREVVRANGLDQQIAVVRGDGRNVALPERADVVVCDRPGSFGLDGGLIDVARHARERLLGPGGALVPASIDLYVAAVEHRPLHGRISSWRDRPAGFDVAAGAHVAANLPVALRIRPPDLLTAPAHAASIALLEEGTWPIDVSASLVATREGLLHGVAGWFVAHLSADVSITNDPRVSEGIARRQLAFPTPSAVFVRAGTGITFNVRFFSEDVCAWEIRVGDGRQTFRQDSTRGRLLSREDVRRGHPAYVPSLSPAGAARAMVLGLCDGTRSMETIERMVFEGNRDLFTSQRDAGRFVADIVRLDGRD